MHQETAYIINPLPSGSTVKVFAPATVANVVCGYDVLGFALQAPGDQVELTLNDSGEVTLDLITGDDGLLPIDPDKNIASAVVKYYLNTIGRNQGVSVVLHKKMPLNSGMGSSSASSVAALVAVNHLMGNPLSRIDLLPLAMEGERIGCGNAHADNVAPALLGGLVLVRSHHPLDAKKLPFPPGLHVAVIHPHVDVPTRESRRILKDRVPLRDAVTQWGNVAGLVAGFCTGDIGLIGRSMEDVIFEPVRAMLIPGFYELKQTALNAGAIGFGISGSGPSVFALCQSEATALKICEELKNLLNTFRIQSDTFVSEMNPEGASIVGE